MWSIRIDLRRQFFQASRPVAIPIIQNSCSDNSELSIAVADVPLSMHNIIASNEGMNEAVQRNIYSPDVINRRNLEKTNSLSSNSNSNATRRFKMKETGVPSHFRLRESLANLSNDDMHNDALLYVFTLHAMQGLE